MATIVLTSNSQLLLQRKREVGKGGGRRRIGTRVNERKVRNREIQRGRGGIEK